MSESDEDKGETYSVRASVAAVVVSIAIAGVANVWMLASWKGAMDTRMADFSNQLTVINQKLERSDALNQRVSVLETKMEAVLTEGQRTRAAVDDLRLEIARASRAPSRP